MDGWMDGWKKRACMYPIRWMLMPTVHVQARMRWEFWFAMSLLLVVNASTDVQAGLVQVDEGYKWRSQSSNLRNAGLEKENTVEEVVEIRAWWFEPDTAKATLKDSRIDSRLMIYGLRADP
jgi:hypothetical protein